MEDTKLSNEVTVEKHLQFEAMQDKEAVANFILARFQERYIIPLTVDRKKKHGFCTMAISCLLIEDLNLLYRVGLIQGVEVRVGMPLSLSFNVVQIPNLN